MSQPPNTPVEVTPDERPQRRREYSGAGSTLGLASLIILAVGVAIWWFEFRGDGSERANGSGFGIVQLAESYNPTDRPPAAEAGRAAPNFQLENLGEGASQLTDYRGKWVLINFWASWCGPCRAEVPDLEQFTQRHPDGIVVLGVNQQETPSAAARFVQEFDVTYPILLDRSGEVSQAYRAQGLPVTYLVSPDGVIVQAFRGRITTDDLKALEAEFLAP